MVCFEIWSDAISNLEFLYCIALYAFYFLNVTSSMHLHQCGPMKWFIDYIVLSHCFHGSLYLVSDTVLWCYWVEFLTYIGDGSNFTCWITVLDSYWPLPLSHNMTMIQFNRGDTWPPPYHMWPLTGHAHFHDLSSSQVDHIDLSFLCSITPDHNSSSFPFLQ